MQEKVKTNVASKGKEVPSRETVLELTQVATVMPEGDITPTCSFLGTFTEMGMKELICSPRIHGMLEALCQMQVRILELTGYVLGNDPIKYVQQFVVTGVGWDVSNSKASSKPDDYETVQQR